MMAWSGLNRAVTLVYGGGQNTNTFLAATSVAAIREVGAQTLYLHGLSPAQMNDSVSISSGYTRLNTLPPTLQRYLVGDQLSAQSSSGVADEFIVGPPEPAVENTIPATLDLDSAESIVIFVYQGSSGYNLGTTSPASLQMDVSIAYRDASVLYIASLGKYLMLLARARIFYGESTPNPSNSISDIVAYTADDILFTANVAGPFLLANSVSPRATSSTGVAAHV